MSKIDEIRKRHETQQTIEGRKLLLTGFGGSFAWGQANKDRAYLLAEVERLEKEVKRFAGLEDINHALETELHELKAKFKQAEQWGE